MKKSITAHDVANAVRMIRTLHKDAFLVVEGDMDMRVYKNFIDPIKCKMINALNKENAINLLGILERENFMGVLVIVDSDFDFLEEDFHISKNLLLTDTHDLETMILESPALDKMLGEFGSERKIKSLSDRLNKNIREILVESGQPIGYLRWVSLKDTLSLRFEGLSFTGFINKETLAIDELKLVKTVKNHSQKPGLSDEGIRTRMKELKDHTHNPWSICCGHDLVCILSIGFQKALGSHDAGKVKHDIIERSLRLAYEHSYFASTRLYRDIQGWEIINIPFKILR